MSIDLVEVSRESREERSEKREERADTSEERREETRERRDERGAEGEEGGGEHSTRVSTGDRMSVGDMDVTEDEDCAWQAGEGKVHREGGSNDTKDM